MTVPFHAFRILVGGTVPFRSVPDFSNHHYTYMPTSVTTGGVPDCVAQDVVFVEDLVLHFWLMLYYFSFRSRVLLLVCMQDSLGDQSYGLKGPPKAYSYYYLERPISLMPEISTT